MFTAHECIYDPWTPGCKYNRDLIIFTSIRVSMKLLDVLSETCDFGSDPGRPHANWVFIVSLN